MEQQLGELPKNPIDRSISPKDGMYFPGQEEHYFLCGFSAIKNIQLGILAAGLGAPRNILDMACGHGRVLRMLKAFFPEAKLTACDIDADAIDFCAKTFGAEKVLSHPDLSKVKLNDSFDLVWCGSLLTHLDKHSWEQFMQFGSKILAKDGLLIFTAHGRFCARMILDFDYYYGLNQKQAQQLVTDFEKNGFGFCERQKYSNFGISIASPSWVASFIENNSALNICLMNEIGWDQHQDVYACCYQKERILSEIYSYVGKIKSEVDSIYKKSELEKSSAEDFEIELFNFIERKIIEDKMPFGPRIHRLINSILGKQFFPARK